MRNVAIATFVLLASVAGFAQQNIPVVACGEKPVTRKTAEIVSPAGVRATLELTVRIVEQKEVGGEPEYRCGAEWTLHVMPSGGEAKKIAAYRYTEREFAAALGGDNATYFGGAVLAFSPDGNSVLAYAHVGGYEDWHLPTPIVYDIRGDKVWTSNLDQAFASLNAMYRPPKGCELEYRVLGFAADGRVEFNAAPFIWVEEQDCFRAGSWLLDIHAGKIERVPIKK